MGGNRGGLAVRQAAVGFTQERLAEYIGVNTKTVSRWEQGETEPYARHRTLLADALQLTMEELLALLDGGPYAVAVDGGRSPIRTAPAIQRPQWQAAPAATPGFADSLLASLDQYARADNLNGPLPLLVQQTRFAMSLIRGAVPREQALILAGARLSEFTGWLYQDAGQLHQAMNWTNTALELATEAGHVDLIVYLWMRKANVAGDARRPQLIRQCAEAGLVSGRQLTPRMRAVIPRVEAHAHAMTGDHDACARTIDAAMAEVTDSTSRAGDLAYYCTAGYLEMEAAHCWTELVRPEAAIEHLAAEVEVWDPAYRRDLGLCLARLGIRPGQGQRSRLGGGLGPTEPGDRRSDEVPSHDRPAPGARRAARSTSFGGRGRTAPLSADRSRPPRASRIGRTARVDLITTATSPQVAENASTVAALPVGSFEQHGPHLPLTTDTYIACIFARRLAEAHGLFLLPPITISCSHEHAGFAGTVSISATTLAAVVKDIQQSLEQQGIERLVIVNAHGGNYVLGNIVQQANVERPGSMMLFPTSREWASSRQAAGMVTTDHDDMHAGELETSILLAEAPEVIAGDSSVSDHLAPDRAGMLYRSMNEYTASGVIGRPSVATSGKGRLLLAALTAALDVHLCTLNESDSDDV